jgi:hypothetical protein
VGPRKPKAGDSVERTSGGSWLVRRTVPGRARARDPSPLDAFPLLSRTPQPVGARSHKGEQGKVAGERLFGGASRGLGRLSWCLRPDGGLESPSGTTPSPSRPSGSSGRLLSATENGRSTLCGGRPSEAAAGRETSRTGHRQLAASRSVTHPTRLETRTKESNMCASHWVLNKPKGAMKVKTSTEAGGVGRPRR